ncbi:MAG: diaminopimelate epimerase [Gemmatimonadota bacterium]|nr:diaminopimelate epimerase [Gemmatimonadota bacterium]
MNALSGRSFVKMSGGGNDFVVFDDRERWFPRERSHEIVPRLCRRGLGLGADAVVLLEDDPSADYRMVYYNADGGEAPMCGNGSLCLARYARLIGAVASPTMEFETGSGRFRAEVPDPGDPAVTVWLVPPRDLTLRYRDLEEGPYRRVGFLDTATPHVIALVDEVEAHPVVEEGRRLRHHPYWGPSGTNVNFVELRGPGRIRLRTYERGVEDETLSCGTGATAAAILTHLWGMTRPPVTFETTGGIPLTIDFTPPESPSGDAPELPTDPRLTGDARLVYRGTIDELLP